jgi:hypothetical protein
MKQPRSSLHTSRLQSSLQRSLQTDCTLMLYDRLQPEIVRSRVSCALAHCLRYTIHPPINIWYALEPRRSFFPCMCSAYWHVYLRLMGSKARGTFRVSLCYNSIDNFEWKAFLPMLFINNILLALCTYFMQSIM